MFRSFLALQRVDPGFDANGLINFELEYNGLPNITPAARAAIQNQIRLAFATLPGVTQASATFPFPLAGGFSPIRWGTEEALSDPSKFQAVDPQFVLPGYLETMRTNLIEGRTFNDQDNLPERKSVIIDQNLALKAFGGASAIGKRILIRVRSPEPEWVEIIGVVAHQRTTSLAEPGREQIYFPDAFVGQRSGFRVGAPVAWRSCAGGGERERSTCKSRPAHSHGGRAIDGGISCACASAYALSTVPHRDFRGHRRHSRRGRIVWRTVDRRPPAYG